MGILIITWNFPPRRGGIEHMIHRLYLGLKVNQRVFVITSHAQQSLTQDGAIFRAKWPGLPFFFLYALIKGSLVLYRNPAIRVIFGGTALVAPLVLVLARLFRRRAIVQTHGLDIIYPAALYQNLAVRWLRYCDQVVTNSRQTALLAEQKGVHPNLLRVISPGVDVERFSLAVDEPAIRSEFGLAARTIILFVGRLARRKGVKEFIQSSLPQIVHELPEACFLIVGHNPTDSLAHQGDVLAEIQALVSQLGLANHVRLTGWVEDAEIARLLQIADLVILPVLPMKGDVEGFGIVLLEAAAAGKAVVATRTGGIPDAVEDGKSGLLVEPGDYKSLSEAIIRLLRDPRTRNAMGERARERVVGHFRWQDIIKMYEQLWLTESQS
jgi:phosphatidylinositol alpha-1,6-mannosyltransferase